MEHMEQLSDESEPTVSYYMPHHGVLRPDSKSTPLRTVFYVSCSTSTGESLNSILANGGVIQEDLFAILLRLRKNKITLTSDIKKMFRMIFIDEFQGDLLRIAWKDSIDDSIKMYRMNRVVGAGMRLHKWSSNCIELLSNFDVSDADVSLTIPDETKALGLLWRPQTTL
ncbi:integrase catalytic domain-containing protein [Trichonephila clavipes]|nr:integrase catalytic domain-containing protein [Trichonephila clavipes]